MTKRIARTMVAVVVGWMLGGYALDAQISRTLLDGTTPPALGPAAAVGSWRLSDLESINQFSGTLRFSVPVGDVRGRGEVAFPLRLPIETRWIARTVLHNPNESVYAAPEVERDLMGGLLPHVERRDEVEEAFCVVAAGTGSMPYSVATLTRLHWIESDGRDVELVDTSTRDGAFSFTGLNCASGSVTGSATYADRGTTFTSRDGSAMTFVSDAPIHDGELPSRGNNATGYLYKKDGTRYRIEGGAPTWMSDRNGNMISFLYSYVEGNTTISDPYGRVVAIVDSLGRMTKINHLTGEIKVPGFSATRTVTMRSQPLSSVLVDTESIQQIRVLFPASDCTGTSYPDLNANQFNPDVLAEIELPDTRKYQFRYNRYGELGRVVLPTGGEVDYTWGSAAGGTGDSGGLSSPWLIYRRLKSRRVYDKVLASGALVLVSQTEYVCPTLTEMSGTTLTVTEIEKDGSGSVVRTKEHTFHGRPLAAPDTTPFRYPGWREGLEYATAAKDSANATLQSVVHAFGQRAADDTATVPATETTRPRDPRVITTTTTLGTSSAVRTLTYSVDTHNNVTKECASDFGSVANVRCVGRTYQTDTAWVGVPAHLRGLVLTESIGNGSASESQTTYEYDIYPGSAVPTYADIKQHDCYRIDDPYPKRCATYLTRGNITKETRTGSLGGTAVTTVTYDVAGNPLTVTTPSVEVETGETVTTPVTILSYTDAYTDVAGKGTYAFATTITNAKGQPQTRGYQWASARLTTVKDAELNTTSYSYGDALDRLKLVTLPIGQTEFDYNDVSRQIVTRKRLTSAGAVVTQTLEYDGLGRTVKTKLSEGTPEIITTMEYDALGRVWRVSNPTRATPTEFTTTAYDNLDRPTLVTQPDGSLNRACYTNNEVLQVDAAGKWSKTIHDGLGRLTTVAEDPTGSCQSLTNTGGSGLLTTYLYTARDLLSQVTQGGQTRTFAYDSLGRLTSATNPESGATTYTYDSAGNLKGRSMSGRSVAMKYDLLHRPVRKTYTDASGTPEVTYCYDGSIAGVCVAAPTGVGKNLTGRLTMVNSPAARVKYGQYDGLGRVLSHSVDFGGPPYAISYAHNDLMLTAETYPSGRIVSYSPDAAGRVSGVSGTTSGEASKTYASGIHYSAYGPFDQVKLGNNLWETTCFNSRRQMTLLAVGATSTLGTPCESSIIGTDYSALRLDYGYAAGNNGNVASQTIWTGGTQLETQSYSYDELNRLKTAVAGGWRQTYVIDRYGNRAVLSGTVGGNYVPDQPGAPQVAADDASQVEAQFASNRWSGAATDAAGNVTQPVTGAYPQQLTYDGENRIVSVLTAPGSTMSFVYDGDGRRVKKTVGAVTTTYVHDALGRVVAEYGGVADASGLQYLTADHLGSTRLVTDPTGAVVKRHDYLPFGQELPVGLGGRTSDLKYQAFGFDDPQRVKFTGKERDSESGLDYFGARYYSGAQGRFTSPDAPFADQVPSDPQSWNLYTYVGNNPLRHVDATGQCFRPGGNCAQYFAGVAKAVGNIPSDIINAPNRMANSFFAATDLRFNDLVPQTFQASNADQREGMEAAGVAMVVAPIAEAGVTKLLDVLGTGARMESGVVAGISPKVGEAGGPGAGKPFPNSVKDAARAESGNTCVFCGQTTQRTAGTAQSNIDHAIPKSRDGNNTLPNAQNTCRTCNLDKGTRTTREYEDELRRRQQN